MVSKSAIELKASIPLSPLAAAHLQSKSRKWTLGGNKNNTFLSSKSDLNSVSATKFSFE